MSPLLWVALAFAGDVRVELARGVTADYTDLVVEVVASSRPAGAQTTKAVEQHVRLQISAGLEVGIERMVVADGTTLADWLADPELGPAIRARISRWGVTEARYKSSGEVGLTAELSIRDLLKPLVLQLATDPTPLAQQPRYTGLVVDARGTGATPGYLPKLVDDAGNELWSGTLGGQHAVTESPAVYVTDAGDEAAARAGTDPMFVRASDARDVDLVLAGAEAQRYRTGIMGAAVLDQGTVVVIVDP